MKKTYIAVNHKTADKLKQVVNPFILNGYYLIALDPSWSNALDEITFDVEIVNRRLQITSTEKMKN